MAKLRKLEKLTADTKLPLCHRANWLNDSIIYIFPLYCDYWLLLFDVLLTTLWRLVLKNRFWKSKIFSYVKIYRLFSSYLILIMEENVADNEVFVNATIDGDSQSAVNSLILDYYQKFGKKRDLEQFFSLSTADSDIRDPSSLFWRKMKMQSDSSDSGEGKAGTSTELCRISIKCSVPEHSSSPVNVYFIRYTFHVFDYNV